MNGTAVKIQPDKPSVRLAQLDPHFVILIPGTKPMLKRVGSIELADGLGFLCPKCWRDSLGKSTVRVLVWQPLKVPEAALPGPGRWAIVGTGVDDLSLLARAPVIDPSHGCGWRGVVELGLVSDA